MALALERSAATFSRKVLVGDQTWMARQGGWRLGGEFEPWASALFVEERALGPVSRRLVHIAERRDPLPPPLAVPDVPPVEDPVYRLSQLEMERIQAMMDLSSRCDQLPGEKLDKLMRLIDPPGRSYVVTHQLWALVTAYHLACVDQPTFDRLRPRLATIVYAELLADTAFNDLMAERMAMLAYAGLVSWIPPEATQLALDTQHPSGVWLRHQVDIGPFATSNVMHMSTLAFYALASVWMAHDPSRRGHG